MLNYNCICPISPCGKRWIDEKKSNGWIEIRRCADCDAKGLKVEKKWRKRTIQHLKTNAETH